MSETLLRRSGWLQRPEQPVLVVALDSATASDPPEANANLTFAVRLGDCS
jgi:hypothetical protein